jgi:hypothetical protein
MNPKSNLSRIACILAAEEKKYESEGFKQRRYDGNIYT